MILFRADTASLSFHMLKAVCIL